MKSGTRASIAFIAAKLSGSNSSHVYDYSNSKYVNFSGSATESSVNVYDYDRSCYVTGTPNSLYDYGNSAHIQLQISGNQISGYEYDSGNHFSGTVRENSVSLFDYETSSYYEFST
jgi:hypothetical protein